VTGEKWSDLISDSLQTARLQAENLNVSPQEIEQLKRLMRRNRLENQQAQARFELIAKLEKRRFNFEDPPPEPEPRFWIQEKGIFTPGNIGVIQAQAGTGKSSLIAAMIAARICAENGNDRDTLGVTAEPGCGVLIHIDTEQSPFDHDSLIRRVLKRADVQALPSWLQSYTFAGMAAKELREALRALLWSAMIDGIHSVIVDGVGDLVSDVNEAEECNAFVAELHAMAIQYETSIIGILHENPGTDNGKGRGHLGSQLTRKAEAVLRLVKTDEVTTIFSQKARRAPILEKDAPRFRWCNEAGMHVSVSAGEVSTPAMQDALSLAAEAFQGDRRLRWKDLFDRIVEARGCAKNTAERKIKQLEKLGVIKTDGMGFKERVL
jgi:hypothetical protein